MNHNETTALVLEGGGMRGVFTSGVLDCFMDHGVEFPYCVGVSAGACNGLSYMSRQRGRARRSNIDMLEKYRYIGMKYLWTQHSILDQDFLYDRIVQEVLPFDFAACFANPMRFEMVVTNCRTGRADYLEERADARRLILAAKASSSLPFVCPIVWLDGEPLLDGGIVDSIPMERALSQGYDRLVVVSTRHKGYRDRGRDLRTPRFIYKRHPRLRLVLSRRHQVYNRQLGLMERLEAEGRALVIRPPRPVQVDRLESDPEKLFALYHEGYTAAAAALPRL